MRTLIHSGAGKDLEVSVVADCDPMGRIIVIILLEFSRLLAVCNSLKGYAFVKEGREAPAMAQYDYIVVGGGTAGCPLAATLSQNFSVLLLERGGSPYGNRNVSRIENFHLTLADTSPSSASQEFISEDGVFNARGRVLGGSTAINAGFYTRASPEYVRNVGWDGKLVNDSYQWVEKLVVNRPALVPWQRAVRDGLLEAGVSPYNGFTYDHLYGTKEGGTTFSERGHRHTSADLLTYANPRRLTVLLHATAQRVLFTNASQDAGKRSKSNLVGRGILYRDADGVDHEALLTDEVGGEIIISAGALGSPQLLMLSGIGPAEHLSSLGVHVELDQPGVGQGMADNPMNAIFVPTPYPMEKSLIQVVGITKFGSYIEASSGFGTTPDSIHRKFGRMSPQGGVPRESFRGGFILEKIMGPLSRGRLLLKNTNVEDNPSVTFNYFQHPRDLRRCVRGISTIEKVVKSRHFVKFLNPNISLEQLRNMSIQADVNLVPKHANGSTSLEQFCRESVNTLWHYHGGCQVGIVVDKDYRLIGVDALRVIDGSTFIFSPGTNPQATVMMLGRYMGVTILRERLEKAAGA